MLYDLVTLNYDLFKFFQEKYRDDFKIAKIAMKSYHNLKYCSYRLKTNVNFISSLFYYTKNTYLFIQNLNEEVIN